MLNQARLKVLKVREDHVRAVLEEARKRLGQVTTDQGRYAQILESLILQALYQVSFNCNLINVALKCCWWYMVWFFAYVHGVECLSGVVCELLLILTKPSFKNTHDTLNFVAAVRNQRHGSRQASRQGPGEVRLPNRFDQIPRRHRQGSTPHHRRRCSIVPRQHRRNWLVGAPIQN